jgi:uncharacterized membrane protein
VLAVLLLLIYGLWLVAALIIYNLTLGPDAPASLGAFAHDVFATPSGWVMIVAGVGIGFLFAVLVLVVGAISFPMLLDRPVDVETAIRTSARAAVTNPGPMALWGAIVVAGLVIGSIPLLVGLIVVLPVLGHSTWHLYRAMVPR